MWISTSPALAISIYCWYRALVHVYQFGECLSFGCCNTSDIHGNFDLSEFLIYLVEFVLQKAQSQLAYDLQAAKTKQAIKEESMTVKVIERSQQIKVQEQVRLINRYLKKKDIDVPTSLQFIVIVDLYFVLQQAVVNKQPILTGKQNIHKLDCVWEYVDFAFECTKTKNFPSC